MGETPEIDSCGPSFIPATIPTGAMGFDGFTMPPALAGDNNEVTADADGATNWLSVTGGLTAIALAGAVAFKAKDRILNILGADAESQVSVSVN